ncbi:hypothetical protein C8R44DRAFT_952503 [Mycena epipterygia]|nr:hypothetical protein C8R44DRAFT_952503 [Mycena epipterygia]
MAYDTKDEAKLYRFEMGLAPGKAAEKWWDKLDAVKERATWKDLMVAFRKKWPAPIEAEETPEELKMQIKSTILRSKDLGKMVGPAGDQMNAHVRWVADMKPLLEIINDPTMLLKGDVRATLPLEIRVILPKEGLTTWAKFFAAVKALDSESIHDELERSGRYQCHGMPDISREIDGFDGDRPGADLYAHVQSLWSTVPPLDAYMARTVLPTPPPQTPPPKPPPPKPPCCASATCHLPDAHVLVTARTSGSTPTPNAAHTSQHSLQSQPVTPQHGIPPHLTQMQMQSSAANPFAPLPYQGNQVQSCFVQQLMQGTPGSPSQGRGARNTLGGDPVKDLAIAKRTVAAPHTYAPTPAGIQLYQADLAAWDAMYAPSSRLTPDWATFPLTPGMLPAGSKECWSCGLIGEPPHFGAAKCRLSGSTLVSQRESNVRALIGNALYPPGERAPIAMISDGGYNPMGIYDVHQVLFDEQEDPETENGEGLA